MGAFDKSGRRALMEDPFAVLARLFRGELVKPTFVGWRDSRTTPKPDEGDLTADRVAELLDPRENQLPWLMVFELQAQQDEDKLDTILLEVARVRREMRHGKKQDLKYQVLSSLIYLCGECPESEVNMALVSGRGTKHKSFEWNVAQDDADESLTEFEQGKITWGILFWIALMRRGGEPQVIRRWLGLVQTIAQESRRADLYQIALVFAELAGCLPTWQEALQEFLMLTESQVVNSWIASAVQNTQLTERRDNLVRLLNGKFKGEVTSDVLATINQQPNLDLLREWFDKAVDVQTFAEFVKFLRR